MGRALIWFRNLPAAIVAILLIGCLVAYYSTRDSAPSTATQKSAADYNMVDTSLLESAISLAPLAATPDEQAQAREAWRLADHELDLRFAAAMLEAETEAALPPTGPLVQLSARVAQIQARVDADKKRVDDLKKSAGGAL